MQHFLYLFSNPPSPPPTHTRTEHTLLFGNEAAVSDTFLSTFTLKQNRTRKKTKNHEKKRLSDVIFMQPYAGETAGMLFAPCKSRYISILLSSSPLVQKTIHITGHVCTDSQAMLYNNMHALKEKEPESFLTKPCSVYHSVYIQGFIEEQSEKGGWVE